jgi:hypothetical protein
VKKTKTKNKKLKQKKIEQGPWSKNYFFIILKIIIKLISKVSEKKKYPIKRIPIKIFFMKRKNSIIKKYYYESK